MCGKNRGGSCGRRVHVGSPPRVREELLFCRQTDCKRGITPACAGRTPASPAARREGRDHPRVCGKNAARQTCSTGVRGSPPRVREEPSRSTRITDYGGITPACAGRTAAASQSVYCWRDHPRVCGKNKPMTFRPLSELGSPPRVREELLRYGTQYGITGITPACAGRTRAGA